MRAVLAGSRAPDKAAKKGSLPLRPGRTTNGSNESELSAQDLAEAKQLRSQGAMLFIEGAPLTALQISAKTVTDSGSFDGTSSKTTILKSSSGLLLEQHSINDQPSESKSPEERGGGGFADSRVFLYMNRAGFQYALARGQVFTPDPQRIPFIKANPDSQVVQKTIRPGTDAVLFNSRELYTVTNVGGQEQWKRIMLSAPDGDPWIKSSYHAAQLH
jgi:hypothetical protein